LLEFFRALAECAVDANKFGVLVGEDGFEAGDLIGEELVLLGRVGEGGAGAAEEGPFEFGLGFRRRRR
jgi:hypothetical protein